jgi:hypothetical protein
LTEYPAAENKEGEDQNAIGQALELALIPKKNGRCLGGPQRKLKLISVYQRTCCGANLSDNPPKKSGHTS